jgi:plastocyanin
MRRTAIAQTPLLARRPLRGVDRLSLAGLLVCAVQSGLVALLPGARGGPLPYLCAGLLLSTGLVWAGIRWAPILGALFTGVVLVTMFTATGYPIYHLTQPKAQFGIFVGVIVGLTSLITTLGITLYTAALHYLPGQPRATSRWLTPAFTGLIGMALGAILIAGIAQPASASNSAAGGEPVVHLGSASFEPALVAVPRGAKLLVVDDGTILHVLANGSWEQGRAAAAPEQGAPRVDNVRINGGSVVIGPFTAPGTFYILCLVHPGMSLTVVVP